MSVGGEDVSSSLSSDDCIVLQLFSFGTYPVKSRISVAIGINSERQKTKIVRKYTTSFIFNKRQIETRVKLNCKISFLPHYTIRIIMTPFIYRPTL